MAFATELQGWSSHKALLLVQDFEIGLLETVKKCMLQRVKCDKEYASALAAIVSTAQKQETAEHPTPLYQAWMGITKDMGNVVQLVNENAERLAAQTAEKLTQIINSKKVVRKLYSEQRNRLELELYRMQEEVNKNRIEYETRLNKLGENRAKYEELFNKGRTSTKLEEFKSKYVRSEVKVHNVHNAYAISLCELNVYQQHYLSVTLPLLLDLHQKFQEDLAKQSHEVLLEFARLTDWSDERFRGIYGNMYLLMTAMSSQMEYSGFISKNRSEPVRYSKQEFCTALLNNTCRSIEGTDIVVNDWTLESVEQSKALYTEQLNKCRQLVGSKRQALREMEEDRNSANSITTISSIKRELYEQSCLEEKYLALLNLVTGSLDRLNGSDQTTQPKPDRSSIPSKPIQNGASTASRAASSASASSSSAQQQIQQTLSNLRTAFTKKMTFANASLRTPKKKKVPTATLR